MKPLVYVETSVISYLAARPSLDLLTAANQQLTQQWWILSRPHFDLVVSDMVLIEARAGDADAARRRLELLRPLRTAVIDEESRALARSIMRLTHLPKKAEADSVHIAVAAQVRAQYLLTWNLKHIAAASHKVGIESACRAVGLAAPVMCSPGELMWSEP